MKENNATCKVCGTAYHRCLNCEKNQNNFVSYKLVACSHNCFKIHATILSGDSKETQRETLKKLDLTNLETFEEEVKAYIKDVLATEKEILAKEIIEDVKETIVIEQENKEIKTKKIG